MEQVAGMAPGGGFNWEECLSVALCIALYSTIHKATSQRQEHPQRPSPYSRLQGFSGIVPGKAGNGSAGSFVNSAGKSQSLKPNFTVNSAIHKAADLTVSGFAWYYSTIPLFH